MHVRTACASEMTSYISKNVVFPCVLEMNSPAKHNSFTLGNSIRKYIALEVKEKVDLFHFDVPMFLERKQDIIASISSCISFSSNFLLLIVFDGLSAGSVHVNW